MKSKLSKLSMPKRDEVDMSELDMEHPAGEESPEYEASEGMDVEAGESPETEAKEHPGGDLADIADEDLIAEMKKRGLMSKLAEEGAAEADMSDEEMYS